MKRFHFCLTIAALVVVLLQPHAVYAIKYWKNSVGSGLWGTGSNWSAVSAAGADNGGVPVTNEPARIAHTDGVSRTVSYNPGVSTIGLLAVDQTGGSATNTLSMTFNNSLTAAGIFIGGHNGAGTTNGRGTLTQSDGTLTTSPGTDLYLASGAGSTGIYNLSGGALNANLSTVVGSGGTGTFNHSGGTHTLIAEAIGGALLVGYLPGGSGTYNLSGTGQLIANKNEIIGVDGVGQFFQTGGTNTVNGAFQMILGYNASGNGTYTLSGGTLSLNQSLQVGLLGTGVFTQTGGVNTVNIGGGSSFVLGNNAGSSGTYNLSAGTLNGSNQIIGYEGVGQFNQSGGTSNATDIVIGHRAAGQGAYAISGGTLNVGNNAVVGLLGTASLNISGTGVVNANTLSIGPSGAVHMTGGTLNMSNPGATFFYNRATGGSVAFTGGTIVVESGFNFASPLGEDFFGTTRTIPAGKALVGVGNVVKGSGMSLDVNGGQLQTIAFTNNSGQLNVSNGGTLNASGFVGIYGGTLLVDGATSTLFTPDLNIAQGSSATANVVNGGTVSASLGRLWNTGTMTLSGAGSKLLSDDFTVEGNLSVLEGALVHIGNLLNVSGEQAVVNLSGGTLRVNALSDSANNLIFNSGTIQLAGARTLGSDAIIQDYYGFLPVIPFGKGLTVEGAATLTKPLKIDGGTFKTNGLTIGAGGSLNFSSGVLELSGGTITGLAQLNVPTNGEFRAAGTHTVRVAGAVGSTITPTGLLILGDFNAVNGFYTNGTVNIGANTLAINDANDAVFDSAAYVTLGNGASPGQLDSLQGLTLNFGGNITGFGEVFTSNAIFTPLINNGHITGASSAQRISLPGYVKGVGTFDNVNFTGTFAPGLSPTSLVVGNIGLSNTSTLLMELGGTSPGSGYDQILSSGALALGGSLDIDFINGFTPTAGNSFNLFDWSTVSGTFSSLLLPALGGGLSWNTSQLYTTGLLSVSAGIPGDFDTDGDVDGRDFLVWQRNTSVGNLSDWQTNYGTGSLTAASTAVPEPEGLMLVGIAMIVVGRHAGRFPI